MRSLAYSANEHSSNNTCFEIFYSELSSAAVHIMNAECSGFIAVSITSPQPQDVIGATEGASSSGHLVSEKCYCTLKEGVLYFDDNLGMDAVLSFPQK